MPDEPFVFLSYARQDLERVEAVYEQLADEGIDVWMDTKELLAGQNWEIEIQRALDKAALVILFLSSTSVSKTGYVQAELKTVLDKMRLRPADAVYAIPVTLDAEVPVPEALQHLQYQVLYGEGADQRLVDAINSHLGRRTERRAEEETIQGFEWGIERIEETWEGDPGYDADVSWLDVSSDDYPDAWQLGVITKAEALSILAGMRAVRLHQGGPPFYYTEGPQMNYLSFGISEPMITGRVISLSASVHDYYAGAAHPNHHFRTWTYVLDPFVEIKSLYDLFDNERDIDGFDLTQASVRAQLLKASLAQMEDELGEGPYESMKERIDRGTETREDLQNFVLDADGIHFLFPPYQVGSYAQGAFFADVSYQEIIDFLSEQVKAALGLT